MNSSRTLSLTSALIVVSLALTAHVEAQSGVIIVPAQTTPAPAPVYAQPAPVYAPAYATAPAPAPRHRGPNIGLIVSGSVMLGVGWISNFLVGLGAGTDPFNNTSDPTWEDFRAYSFIPIGGPWAQLAAKPTSFTHDAWGGWLVIDGLLQSAGTILLIVGIATSVGGDETADAGGVRWAVAPMVSPTQLGLTVGGMF